MSEKSFEKPSKELPPAREYQQIGARLYKIYRNVERNTYTYSLGDELFLLESKMIFEELLQTRIGAARRAEIDLSKTNERVLDPEEAVRNAQARFEKSKQTEEDDARRWGEIFYARPMLAIDKATEAYRLIQERRLNEPKVRLSKKGLVYPAKDFPEIKKISALDRRSVAEKIKEGKLIGNQSDN